MWTGSDFLVFVIVFACISGAIGGAIGAGKGRGREGFLLGLLLGFIGWIIIAVMPRTPEFEAKHVREVQAALGPTQSPVSVTDELLKLGQLRDAKVLSEEEFQQQKSKVLEHWNDPSDVAGSVSPLDPTVQYNIPERAAQIVSREIQRAGIPHRWDGLSLVVPKRLESQADAFLIQVRKRYMLE